MPYVVFDAEMYRASQDKFYQDVKIIAIGYVIVQRNISDLIEHKRTYPRVTLLTEWRLGNEKRVIQYFFEYLKNLSFRGPLRLVGYSTLNYDIPLLIQKLVKFGFGTLEELNEFFYQRIIHIDLRLLGLIYNKMILKGSSLNNTINNMRYKDPILPKVNNSESGSAVHELYKKGNYKQIEKHLENDLKEIIYLYRAMEKYIIPKINF